MHKSIPLLVSFVVLVGFLIGFSMLAAARGQEGGGAGFGHGSPVGPSSNSASFANSNGRFAQDRDKGLERAEDRRSEEGLEHRKAPSARKKHAARAHTTSSSTTGK